jgi:hypothetical protein
MAEVTYYNVALPFTTVLLQIRAQY